MQQASFDLSEAVTLLEQTPATLSALLSGLPERWVRATEGNGTWSPHEVLVHLIHGEQTNWLPRARHILAGEPRPFDPFDRTGLFAESQSRSVGELLATLAELRRENLAVLMGMKLTDEALSQTGLHPELGEVRLHQLLATWVVHDLNHIGQVVRTLARVYADAVGPWRAYLPILHTQE